MTRPDPRYPIRHYGTSVKIDLAEPPKSKPETRRSACHIGYWYSEREPGLPRPTPGNASAEKRLAILRLLESAPEVGRYRGYSTCRICGLRNGSAEHSDGRFVWPSGLAHYVRDHGVWVEEFDEMLAYDRAVGP